MPFAEPPTPDDFADALPVPASCGAGGKHIRSIATSAHALVRWNLCALMLDVSFFSLGMAFFDQNAVLPLLLRRLGASGPLIGAFAAARFLVFSLFQMFVAYGLHG